MKNNFSSDKKNKKQYNNKENKINKNNRNSRNNKNSKKEFNSLQEKRNNYENEENSYDDIVEGRNAVLELLNSDRDINKIFVQAGEKHGSINKIIAIAKENKVVVTEVEKSK